jgi:soluble lytic murein transglycosylase-like protein
MIHKLVQSILLVLFVSIGVNAQLRQERSSSVQERAQKLEPFIAVAAQRYGIDPRILRVLCYLESRYRTEAVSPKGARGPMQFMPETAARYALKNPHDPRVAIDAAARYLRDLLRKFDGRVDLAVAAYNAGEGTVVSFRTGRSLRLASGKVINPAGRITGGIPPYRETQEYVRSAIGFLVNRPTPLTKSFGFWPNTAKRRTANESRDFTIDVMVDESISQLHLAEEAKSVLIEVP